MSVIAQENPKAGKSRSGKPIRLSRDRRNTLLKALADPRRFELLEQIAGAPRPISCSQVLEVVSIAPATLSHHIKELETAGIIETYREGKFHFMSLRPGVLDALASSLHALGRKSHPEDNPEN